MKKLNKNILLKIGPLAVLTVPVITVVACGTTEIDADQFATNSAKNAFYDSFSKTPKSTIAKPANFSKLAAVNGYFSFQAATGIKFTPRIAANGTEEFVDVPLGVTFSVTGTLATGNTQTLTLKWTQEEKFSELTYTFDWEASADAIEINAEAKKFTDLNPLLSSIPKPANLTTVTSATTYAALKAALGITFGSVTLPTGITLAVTDGGISGGNQKFTLTFTKNGKTSTASISISWKDSNQAAVETEALKTNVTPVQSTIAKLTDFTPVTSATTYAMLETALGITLPGRGALPTGMTLAVTTGTGTATAQPITLTFVQGGKAATATLNILWL